ncbi:MAG: carbohydrate kinase family protein [Promethearchaeota archaeon]
MKDKFKIVVIGDLFLDILPSPLPIEKEAILKDGETFIDKVTFQRGGCAGNFCAVLSSLIPESDIIFKTKVGNDKNGDFLEDQLKKYGIITDISRPEGISKGTAITIAISYGDGERHFITYNGVMDDFNVDEIDCDRLFKDGDHLAWRGIWFTPQLLKDSDVFLSEAKNRGLSVSMDLGFDPYWAREATPRE